MQEMLSSYSLKLQKVDSLVPGYNQNNRKVNIRNSDNKSDKNKVATSHSRPRFQLLHDSHHPVGLHASSLTCFFCFKPRAAYGSFFFSFVLVYMGVAPSDGSEANPRGGQLGLASLTALEGSSAHAIS